MATQKQVQDRAAPMNPGVLEDVVQQALAEARRAGADAAEAQAAMGDGLQVTARLGDVETVERTRDKELAVTVYLGQRSGSASTSDFRPEAIRETVRAACTIARYTAADPCSGLADPARLARVIPDLDLYHPWDMDAERAIGLAIECEAAARGADRRIANSEGASVSSHQGLDVYGNSLGFMGARRGTRHGLSCAVIASDGDGMQRDY
ncbi:MAG TPA: DNA gyrase modulator, partial [Acidiferrobacteraceae bacterium]|nr:DNA gyrase modulator [Acidiferrobacteraceae bacterium]